MNEEEKKRFNMLKKWMDDGCDTSEITFCTLGNLACLVKIIERQQKEIENLQLDNYELNNRIDMLIAEIKYGAGTYCKKRDDCEVVGGNRTCEECIKEYFKNKAEGDK